MTEISDEELERRMRAKLFGGAPAKPDRLSEEEEAIACKLMGADNARRIATAREGRKVRIVPVTVSYSWYRVRSNPNARYSWERGGFWRMERITNGQREHVGDYDDRHALDQKIRDIRKSEPTVEIREFRLDGDTPEPRSRPESRKKSIIAEIGNIRL